MCEKQEYITCPNCNGFGEIHEEYESDEETEGYWTGCSVCNGEGCIRQ